MDDVELVHELECRSKGPQLLEHEFDALSSAAFFQLGVYASRHDVDDPAGSDSYYRLLRIHTGIGVYRGSMLKPL